MAAEIDVRAISGFSSLPESSITTLLDAPTVELVSTLLKGIEANAKEFQQSKSQRIRLEVEYETAVRTHESKVKALQNTRDNALADASKLRVDLQTSENARLRLESDLQQLRSSASNEASETTTLKSRISSLEAANRDTLALLESKTSAYDKLSKDLSAQHQKAVDLRKQISSLEQSTQAANSSVASFKYKEQSLQQEIDLLKKNNEWLENERKIKADEHTRFRKEKNAQVAELSRSNEQHISEVEALKRTETSLKYRLDEQISKYEESSQETQRVREEKISDAENFRIEIESVNRLAELQKASADTAKQRVQELSVALDETREEASDEIGRLRAETESEHTDKLAAEQRVADLEKSLEQLQSELEQSRARPSTPQQPINGNGIATPLRPGTPIGIFSPSSTSRLKGSLSTTQLYTEYKKLEKELANEKRVSEQLQSNVDSMLEELEANKPEIDELRTDHSRLQGEVLEMSNLVDRANEERDEQLKLARSSQSQLQAKNREITVLSQQLRDAGSEIRYLLMEQYVREQGNSLSQEDFQQLQRQADESMQREVENLSDTQQVVNQQLIVFRSIAQLQEQNENQLKTIRNLVETLENAETQERQQRHAAIEQELAEAKSQIASYQEEIRTMVVQSKSFVKERDMFRNMLTRRGHGVDPTDFSRSLPVPAAASPGRGFDENSAAEGESDYAKLLKDLQQHFDSYRREAATDHSSLKSQVDELSKRNSQLQTEASRVVGQLSAANERWDQLQENFNMLKSENVEIQKRSYAAMENATKQEMKTQQAAEELVEARGMLDSLRRESANLKAEKDLWKSVEKRLLDDNETLRNERGRSDQLNSSLQSILNEREQTDSESRRRLQTQVESLETELQSSKRKLNEEIEESKKASLRKEYEHEQSQKRLDDLVSSLGTTREELAAAKTSRDHLQARVDELTVELRSAEERLEVLMRPAPEAASNTNGADESSLSREQDLSIEVSELKRDLELKTTEMERANEQVEVYKNISQSSEERLQELSETNDQYREETDAAITERDARIKDLEQRIEDISAELSTTNTELSQLRDQQSESNRKLDEQKTALEAEIQRLKEQEERNAEQALFNLEASKMQAQIATEAQQNYETELLKHAEAAKTLQTVRAEANDLRLQLLDLKTQAEAASADLQQKDASSSEMKSRYEQEISDLKQRREEVIKQNTLLHGQLEGVTQQISALQRDRAALGQGEAAESSGSDLEGLQEVIKYLRREKEIVDVQYHLSTQELKRLRQQLDFVQSQLDETRLKLDQQRRAEADTERNAMSHNKLMETLVELNLFRESSVTLRAENKQATQALAEKNQRIEDLETQLQPLKARIAELEHLVELREGEMKLLQEDRDHWQQRTQNILSKYDRVDPAELESLKNQISTLETERDDAVAARDDLQAQVDGIPEQVEAGKLDLKNRLQDQFKGRVRELNTKIKDLQAEVDNAISEKNGTQTELEYVREQLESARNQSATSTAPQINGEADDSQSNTTQVAQLEIKISELESSLSSKVQEIASIRSDLEKESKAKENELKGMLNKRLAEVKADLQKAKETALEELRQNLSAEHQQELEALRSQSVPISSELPKPIVSEAENGAQQPSLSSTEIPDSALEYLTEAQARHLVQKNEVIRGILRTNLRKSAEKEREAGRKEAEERLGANAGTGSNEQIQELEQKFATEKEALIQEKEAEFTAEKESLIKQHQEEMAKTKQELVIKNQEAMSSYKLEFSQESERKIAEQVANAEKMSERKSQLKVTMAQNQARTANAKLDVVKKAAEETPEKAVSEVWLVAKDTKPPPQAAPAKPATSTPPVAPTQPAAPASTPAPASTTPQTSAAAQPTQSADKADVSEPVAEASAVEAAQNETTSDASKTTEANPSNVSGPTRQPSSSLPRGAGTFRGRGGGSAGQAASGIPQSAGRGTGIPRGAPRGRGGDRGGGRNVSAINTQHAPAGRGGGGAGSPNPSRGGLNPHAQQFTPGGKRTRDEGEAGDAGNTGKRIRGGGVGA